MASSRAWLCARAGAALTGRIVGGGRRRRSPSRTAASALDHVDGALRGLLVLVHHVAAGPAQGPITLSCGTWWLLSLHGPDAGNRWERMWIRPPMRSQVSCASAWRGERRVRDSDRGRNVLWPDRMVMR